MSYAPMSRASHPGSTGGVGGIAGSSSNSNSSSGPTQLEMDEALARQLQRAELDGISTPLILGGGPGGGGGGGGGGGLGGSVGGGLGGGGVGGGGRDGSIDEARQTRLNALQNVREVRSASFALCIVLLVNIPQIIAAVVILAKYWDDTTCVSTETAKWKTYALIAAMRMFLYVSSVTALYYLNGRGPSVNVSGNLMRFLSHARNGLDAFGLIWFVVGNMWLFGGDVEVCPHPNRSPLYSLCVAFVFINYAQLCLPCVVVIVMLPVLCFCLPCLIRVLARIQDPMRGKGATPTMINKLPLMKYRQVQAEQAATAATTAAAAGAVAAGGGQGQDHQQPQVSVTGVESNSTSCAICISEYAPDEDVRLLPCAHYFHASCVDEWLKVNASCPTCRASILPEHADQPTPRSSHYGTTSSSAAAAAAVGSISTSSSLSGGSAGNSPGGGPGGSFPVATSPPSSSSPGGSIPMPGTPMHGGGREGGREGGRSSQSQQRGDHLV